MYFAVYVDKKAFYLDKFVLTLIIRGEVICTFVQDYQWI